MAELGVMTPEAKRYVFDVIFRGQDPVRTLWVGLARRPLDDRLDLATFSLTEPPPSTGYKRLSLPTVDWTWDGSVLVAKPRVFINLGREAWPRVDIGFLTTVESGTSGVLLGWSYLQHSRDLFPLDESHVPIRIKWA